MRMYSDYLLNYILCGLKASPGHFETLFEGFTEGDPRWDNRTDPDRFSPREALAHLADWEPIWVERMSRIINEDLPKIKSIDEGELAVLHDYAGSSPTESLQKFRAGRERVVALLESLSEPQWHRQGDREGVGPMSLFEMAAMITGHDGYHAIHARECLAKR